MAQVKVELRKNEFEINNYPNAEEAFEIKVTDIKQGNFSDQIRATINYGNSVVEGLFQWYNNKQYLDDWTNENGDEIPHSLYIRESIEYFIATKVLKVKK